MRRGLLILAGFGYIMLLMAGMDTGLGVYRTPAYSLASVGCAIIAALCSEQRQRFFWVIAALAAILFSVYGFQQNNQWRERLDRFQKQQNKTGDQMHVDGVQQRGGADLLLAIISSLLGSLLELGPGIFERDGAVEDRRPGLRVFRIHCEIAQALELISIHRFSGGEARLQFAVAQDL
jgi:hypothetical protein